MLHLSEAIENASEAVSNIAVVKGNCMMKIMADSELTHEQKLKIVELLKPVTQAITTAQSAFISNAQ